MKREAAAYWIPAFAGTTPRVVEQLFSRQLPRRIGPGSEAGTTLRDLRATPPIIHGITGLTFADSIAISTPPGTSGLLALDWMRQMTGSTRSSDGLDDRRKRLLFRCWHRGTREMDLILGRFADTEIASLSDGELAQLEHLIEVPDPDLYAALTGDRPLAPEYASALFDRIKAFRAVEYDA
jgi:antitoxin CptB